MRSWKIVAAAAVVAAVGLGAAGCAPTSGGSGSKVLTVVSWKSADKNEGDMKEINKLFEKAHPDITLKYTWVDNPDWLTYNNPRFAAGTAADVLMLDRVKMNAFASQGYLADLSDQPWVKRMYPNLAPFNQYDGKTYQFNAENIPIGLYANMDLLAKAGITQVPTDWPSFIDDLGKLKAAGIGGLVVPNKGGWMGEQISLELAASLVPKGFTSKYDAGKAKFDPTWEPVVDRFKELFSKGLVDPATSEGLDPNVDGVPQFQAGKWAFMVQGAWALTGIQQNASFKLSLNAFPGGDAGAKAKAFNFVGSGWFINAKAKNPTAARTYLDFLASPKIETLFLKAEAGFSTLKNVPSPSNDAASAIRASFDAGDVTPSMAQTLNDPDAETGITKGIENIFLNPTAPSSDSTKMLDTLVKPTTLADLKK